MRLSEIYTRSKKPVITFEVFPPKTDQGVELLIQELQKLKKFNPGYISVTYGAGGSTQGKSLELINRIVKELELPILAHLTCIGSTPESIKNFIEKINGFGLENILALRGDHPKDDGSYRPESNFFKYASDLVSFTKNHFNFDVAVAGYPEVHPEARSLSEEIDYLKIKMEAGASAVITQLFFNNDDFYRFYEKAQAKGINVPIIPGILPIAKLEQVPKITSCGAKFPIDLMKELLAVQEDSESVRKKGVEHAARQIEGLIKFGVKGIHLYPFNKAQSVKEVLEMVNI